MAVPKILIQASQQPLGVVELPPFAGENTQPQEGPCPGDYGVTQLGLQPRSVGAGPLFCPKPLEDEDNLSTQERCTLCGRGEGPQRAALSLGGIRVYSHSLKREGWLVTCVPWIPYKFGQGVMVLQGGSSRKAVHRPEPQHSLTAGAEQGGPGGTSACLRLRRKLGRARHLRRLYHRWHRRTFGFFLLMSDFTPTVI